MTDPVRPTFTCPHCAFNADSKFALKRHKSHCVHGLPARTIRHMDATRDHTDAFSDRLTLMHRETRYHRFVRE